MFDTVFEKGVFLIHECLTYENRDSNISLGY